MFLMNLKKSLAFKIVMSCLGYFELGLTGTRTVQINSNQIKSVLVFGERGKAKYCWGWGVGSFQRRGEKMQTHQNIIQLCVMAWAWTLADDVFSHHSTIAISHCKRPQITGRCLKQSFLRIVHRETLVLSYTKPVNDQHSWRNRVAKMGYAHNYFNLGWCAISFQTWLFIISKDLN